MWSPLDRSHISAEDRWLPALDAAIGSSTRREQHSLIGQSSPGSAVAISKVSLSSPLQVFIIIFFLLVADQALGIFIDWSKRIGSLKPLPSQAADLIDMVMRQDWPAGRPCFSQHEILVWRFLFFPQEQAYERCLIRTDWRWTHIAHSEMCKFSGGVVLRGPFFYQQWQRNANSTNTQEKVHF